MAERTDAVTERERVHERAVAIAIAAGTLVAYTAVLRAGFLSYDDPGYVAENDWVRQGVTARGISWALRAGEMCNWHPLTWMSHMLDVQLFGVSAVAMHVVNVVIHTANALILFALLGRLTHRMWCSAIVSALFALHPAHVESVAWISERKDVLSTLFWLLSTLCYVKYARTPTLARYLATALLLALGLTAKPMLVTLPLTFLLLDVWPLRRIAIRGGGPPLGPVLLEKVPLLALAAASCAATFWAQTHAGAVASIESLPIASRLANALVSYVRYVGLLLWPTNLAALYPHPGQWPAAAIAGAVAVLIAISTAAARWARTAPYFAFGWLFFLGTLVPVIGIVQVGQQSIADRYTYVPFIGLFIAIVWGAADLASRIGAPKALVGAAAAAWLAALGAMTAHQVGYWTDTLTLFTHALQVTERNAVAHDRVGEALNLVGRHAEAREHFRAVLAIEPGHAGAHLGLGMAAFGTGRLEEAVLEYRQALRGNPRFAEAHGNLALALRKQGRLDEAIDEFAAAAALSPNQATAHSNLANALLSRGRSAEAIRELERALRLRPRAAPIEYNLGNALFASGDLSAAVGHYRRALQLDPTYVPAHNNLAIALARAGQTDAAITEMRRAIELDPGLVDTRVNLAALLRAVGRRDQAVVELRAAAAAARTAGRDDLAAVLEEQLQLQLRDGSPAP